MDVIYILVGISSILFILIMLYISYLQQEDKNLKLAYQTTTMAIPVEEVENFYYDEPVIVKSYEISNGSNDSKNI